MTPKYYFGLLGWLQPNELFSCTTTSGWGRGPRAKGRRLSSDGAQEQEHQGLRCECWGSVAEGVTTLKGDAATHLSASHPQLKILNFCVGTGERRKRGKEKKMGGRVWNLCFQRHSCLNTGFTKDITIADKQRFSHII